MIKRIIIILSIVILCISSFSIYTLYPRFKNMDSEYDTAQAISLVSSYIEKNNKWPSRWQDLPTKIEMNNGIHIDWSIKIDQSSDDDILNSINTKSGKWLTYPYYKSSMQQLLEQVKELKIKLLIPYKHFANKVEKSILSNNLKNFSEYFDTDEFIKRAKNKIPKNNKEALHFVDGLKKDLFKRFSRNVNNQVSQGGSFDCLHHYSRADGFVRVMFRLILANEEGVHYYAFVLSNKNKTIKIIDYFDLVKGELQSELFRQTAMYGIPNTNKSETNMGTVFSQMLMQQHEKALKTYKTMPLDAQQSKCNILVQIMIASKIDDTTYLKEFESYRALYPNDVCMEFASLDYYVIKNEFEKAHKAIDAVDQFVGGDPFLHVLRGRLFLTAEDKPKALICVKKAITLEPTLELLYWPLFFIYVEDKEHLKSQNLLKDFEKQFNRTLKPAHYDEEKYKQFIENDDVIEWYVINIKKIKAKIKTVDVEIVDFSNKRTLETLGKNSKNPSEKDKNK